MYSYSAADGPKEAAGDTKLTDKQSKVISSTLVSETRNIINSELFNNLGDLDFESRMDDKEVAGGSAGES